MTKMEKRKGEKMMDDMAERKGGLRSLEKPEVDGWDLFNATTGENLEDTSVVKDDDQHLMEDENCETDEEVNGEEDEEEPHSTSDPDNNYPTSGDSDNDEPAKFAHVLCEMRAARVRKETIYDENSKGQSANGASARN